MSAKTGSKKAKAAKTIRITCEGAGTLSLSKMEAFQGDLKELTEENERKLLGQMLELGFSDPFAIWRDDDRHWVIDGHQRLVTLRNAEREGFKVPDLPVVWIEAESYEEAKRKVLALTSQFGKVTKEGLLWMAQEAGLDPEELVDGFAFPDLQLDELTDDLAPLDLDSILQEVDTSTAKQTPIWLVVRADAGDQETLERARRQLEGKGLKVETSYA